MSVVEQQVADLKREADSLRRQGEALILEADALDRICLDSLSIDKRLEELS